MSKRRLDAVLNVVALLFLFLAVPGMVWAGNAWNGFLGQTYEWTAQENATAFYEGPILDGDDEYRYATYYNTSVTEETPTWDVTGDWDQVTIVGTGAKSVYVMNLNKSVDDLLNSKYYSLRMKTNGSQPIKASLYAVKYDGVALTQQQIDVTVTLGNGSKEAYFNWTPTEILQVNTLLNPAATDESYCQIVIESSSTTNNLTAGDVIQFDIDLGSPSNVYTFSSIQILRGLATIGGIMFILFAFGSTAYWNPFTGNSAVSRAKRSYKRKKAKKRRS